VLDDIRRALLRVLTGLIVLAVVMILLRGLSGSVEAIKLQIVTLARSFLNEGDGMAGVLVHTLPLAIAAAVATFAIASLMITFESHLSILGLAGIVLIGASVGGILRRFIPDPIGQPKTVRTVDSKPVHQLAQSSLANRGIAVDPPGLKVDLSRTISRASVSTDLDVNPNSPWQQLSEIDWLAEPDLPSAPPREITRLQVLPEANSVPGAILKAINQLHGYLVADQPRLFLAAIAKASPITLDPTERADRNEQDSSTAPNGSRIPSH
jgi:hypothetical protein